MNCFRKLTFVWDRPPSLPPSLSTGTAPRRAVTRGDLYSNRKPTDYSNQITTGQTETHALSAVQHVFRLKVDGAVYVCWLRRDAEYRL